MELIVFVLGGIFYGLTEVLYRGYTHWSMVLTRRSGRLHLLYDGSLSLVHECLPGGADWRRYRYLL